MQHNQAAQLFNKAQSDLRALRGMQDEKVFDDSVYGFHLQQAVEKGLKAWLDSLGIAFPKTHDINLLLGLLGDTGVEVEALYEFNMFTSYAVQLRYEVTELESGLFERAAALSKVESLLFAVEQLLIQRGKL